MQSGLILESDLDGVEVIACHILTHGNISDPTESVRGRTATPSWHLTTDEIHAAITQINDNEYDQVLAGLQT